MIYFLSDYVTGCHPAILEKMAETNFEQTGGYGCDPYSERAAAKIRTACAAPEADVHFLVGGTQANLTVISGILRPHQGVISGQDGHITCHEGGAIEATGHKVLTLPSGDGTLTAAQVEAYYQSYLHNPAAEHCVQPGMVYISFPTESGTLYSKKQLEALSGVCRRYGLPLYLDGARLGYGLTSPENDLTLADLARLCDVFYIGGTKCGALFGEAVVITAVGLKKDFRTFMKLRGGLLAKGRLLGLQFDVLFENGLYETICGQAVAYALEIRRAFEARGLEMMGASPTNQQFVALASAQADCLAKKYVFEDWGITLPDGRKVYRFCTAWSTAREEVDSLLKDIAGMEG